MRKRRLSQAGLEGAFEGKGDHEIVDVGILEISEAGDWYGFNGYS